MPEDACALLADSGDTFQIVAKALGSSAINRVSTHPWEKLALAGYTKVAIAYSHHPASGVRLADNSNIAATATLDTHAVCVVDRNHCGVSGAMADGIHRLGVCALGGNSCIIDALSEYTVEIFTHADHTA